MLNNLWVMRHGLAVAHFESDFSRELSSVGEAQVKEVAQQMKQSSDSLPTKMLVSPFVRTQSTAVIVHKELGLQEPFETEEMLVHFGDHQLLGDYLLASDYSDLIIVSHMPIVAQLCNYVAPSDKIHGFQTAQVVKIEFCLDNNSALVGTRVETFLPKR